MRQPYLLYCLYLFLQKVKGSFVEVLHLFGQFISRYFLSIDREVKCMPMISFSVFTLSEEKRLIFRNRFLCRHVAELSRIFLVEIFLEFLMYDMISSTNRDSVASSLPIFISLISFACIYCFSWYFEGNVEKEKEW